MHAPARIPGRILVIDDSPAVRETLARVLGRAGHTVVLASCGQEALDHARTDFDLMIVDQRLPDLQGLEVLKVIRARNPGARAIVVTGFPSASARATAESLGVRGYLIKPFDVSDLLHECNAAIEAARSGASAADPPIELGGR